nr:small RNA degrading nuclease 3-like [Ipomoea trifida]
MAGFSLAKTLRPKALKSKSHLCSSGKRWDPQNVPPQRHPKLINPTFLLQHKHLLLFAGAAADSAAKSDESCGGGGDARVTVAANLFWLPDVADLGVGFGFLQEVLRFWRRQLVFALLDLGVGFGIFCIRLEVKLDEFVKPRNAIADYRTDITGITATDLDGVTCSLADVQILSVALGAHELVFRRAEEAAAAGTSPGTCRLGTL